MAREARARVTPPRWPLVAALVIIVVPIAGSLGNVTVHDAGTTPMGTDPGTAFLTTLAISGPNGAIVAYLLWWHRARDQEHRQEREAAWRKVNEHSEAIDKIGDVLIELRTIVRERPPPRP